MSQTELKDLILAFFDQIRDSNTRVAETAWALEERDSRDASLREKLDAVLESQRQLKHDLETWLAKEHRWNKKR